MVSLVDQRTSLVSVLGDVKTASRFPASAAGEHLLDAITRAGGPLSQGFDEWVMLERGGRREIVPFGALVYEPANNIYVHADDTIFLYREPQTFLAFGATAEAQQQPPGSTPLMHGAYHSLRLSQKLQASTTKGPSRKESFFIVASHARSPNSLELMFCSSTRR